MLSDDLENYIYFMNMFSNVTVVVNFSPPLWISPVQETHSDKGAIQGDLSKKSLSDSRGGTKVDNNGNQY